MGKLYQDLSWWNPIIIKQITEAERSKFQQKQNDRKDYDKLLQVNNFTFKIMKVLVKKPEI